MIAVIAIVFPSILGVKLIDYLMKNISLKNTFYYFSLLLLFSTLINVFIFKILFQINSNIFVNLNTYTGLLIEYLAVSITINIILAFIIVMISKNVSMSLKYKKKRK